VRSGFHGSSEVPDRYTREDRTGRIALAAQRVAFAGGAAKLAAPVVAII